MYFVNERNHTVTGFKTLREARLLVKEQGGYCFVTKLDKGKLIFKEHNYPIRELPPSLILNVSKLFECTLDDAQAMFYDLKEVPFEIKHNLFFVKNKRHIVHTIFSCKGTADGYTDGKGNYYSITGKKFHFN